MAEVQMLNQLKFRIASLESNLSDKQKQIDEYRSVESQADSKIKGMNKIHNQKVKSLLNSIQILKKEKASIEGLSKQHKRSKLIEQLNKEILDQDLAIEVMRKYVYEKEGKQQGRKVLDDVIVSALKKGPERIRPLTREELRIQIDKLKQININLERKIKQGDFKKKGGIMGGVNVHDESVSQISSVGSQSFVNQNEEVLSRLRQFQLENQNLKLEVNSKMRIVEKLKTDLKEKDRYKAEVQLLKNQIQMANRKVFTFQKLMKESKQNTNKKLIDLYERELKVQELELMSKENSDDLKTAHNSHNILLDELRIEKEEVEAQLEAMKQENQKIILDNITSRKRQDEQKGKINEIRDINNKEKNMLGEKLIEYEKQVERVLADNKKLTDANQSLQNMLFKERADWTEERIKLTGELEDNRQARANNERNANYMIEIDALKEENEKLREIVESGTGTGGDDRIMMERLDNFKRKVEYLESKDPKKDVQLYNQLFKKHNDILDEFSQLKKTGLRVGQSRQDLSTRKGKRKQIVQINRKEEKLYDELSSGISNLRLDGVDSAVLDNFDTSYEYSIHVNEFGDELKVPKVTEADKELLKLINSDLWYFVGEDNQLSKKIDQVSKEDFENVEDETDPLLQDKLRKLRNISHPKGQRVSLYEEQIQNLEGMSDNVSLTSAMEKQINNYDSDVNIELKKMGNGAPKNLDYGQIKNMNLDIGSEVDVSSVESGVSNIRKKKISNKVGTIKMQKPTNKIFDSDFDSSFDSEMLNSDVSSVGIKENLLNKIDSDVQVDFRKKKNRK